jgi:hypothetical protein
MMNSPIYSADSTPSTFNHDVTINGDLTVTGNFNFGDAGVDIMTIAGYIQGSASGNTSVNIGNGTPDKITATTNDLYVTDELEVDGLSFFDSRMTITGGTLADTTSALLVTATMPGVASGGYNKAVEVLVTPSNVGNQYPFNMEVLSGGTGNLVYAAGRFINRATGIGTAYVTGSNANYALYAGTASTTVGANVGAQLIASGGNINIGCLGLSTGSKGNAKNIGVAGFALNAGGGTATQTAGYFGLQNSAPTHISAALVCDNGSQTSDIFVARDNGTPILSIKDGALLEFNGGLKMKRTTVNDTAYTALVGDYIIGVIALTASRTISLPPVATAGAGKIYVIKDEAGAAGTYPIVIDPDGAELIDGGATKTINANYNAYTVYCTGTAWFTY